MKAASTDMHVAETGTPRQHEAEQGTARTTLPTFAETLNNAQHRFTLARFEASQLQNAVTVASCLFEGLAAICLWKAVDDRAVAVALVPVVLYAVIGAVVYVFGMRYLKSRFAQVGMGEKDWLLSEQVMIAADNGVMLKVPFGTAYVIWDQLLDVVHDSDYYYLLIAPSKGFKIPKQSIQGSDLKIKLDDLASLSKARALQNM